MSASVFWCPTCRTMRVDAVDLRDGRDYAHAPAGDRQAPDVRGATAAAWPASAHCGRPSRNSPTAVPPTRSRPGHGPGATSVDGAVKLASDVEGLRLLLT